MRSSGRQEREREEHVPRAIERFLDGLGTGAWTGMEQHFSPTAVSEAFGTDTSARRSGPAAIVQALRSEWADSSWNLDHIAVSYGPNTVVVELCARRVAGESSAPDHARRNVDVFRLDGGRIVEHRAYRCTEPAQVRLPNPHRPAEGPPARQQEETMSDNQNEALVRRGYEAFAAGDTETLVEVFAPDIVWSVPGRSQIAGEHKGLEAVLGLFGKVAELSNGTLHLELQSVTARGDDQVEAIHRVLAERGDQKLDITETEEMTIENGRISRVNETPSDQHASDAFWS